MTPDELTIYYFAYLWMRESLSVKLNPIARGGATEVNLAPGLKNFASAR